MRTKTHKRVAWTEEEKAAVKQGYKKFDNKWAMIKMHYASVLYRRTNTQIKVRMCFPVAVYVLQK